MVSYFPGVLSCFYSLHLYITLRLLSYDPYATKPYNIATFSYNTHRSLIQRRRVACQLGT